MPWNQFKRRRGAPHPVAAKSRCRPRDVSLHLERLEDRIAPAIITPFTVRFAANTTGDTAIIGNTLETASTVGNPGRAQQDVTNAQNGTGSFVNDNDWNMAYVDMDGNSSTSNSSQASLNLPDGSSVLFAGLYWMGNSSSAQRNKVMLSTPASGGYTTLTGKVIGDSSGVSPAPSPSGPNYEGFVDVTSLVQAGGNGAYTLANVQATIGTNYYAGWSMIVAFRAPGLPARNLTVFDGYGVIQSGDPALNIPISGFIAPPSGTVNAKISVVAAEGDLGLTGDSMKMNGTTLSNSLNPSDNFFNSSITNAGSPLTAKNPNYTNQLGFDADSVQVPAGTIANSATSATVTLTTSGDTYFPGAVATTIDLYAPKLDAVKNVTDLSGGNNLPGDTLEYVVNVTNNGQDPAGNVILNDPIPANTTYVPGSLRIATGANAGTKTDAAGDDQARFDSANNQVVFNLGTGATATIGGNLAIGAATSIVFDVKVNNNVAANTVIINQATLNYIGVTTGFSFTSLSTAPGFTVTNSFADIAVTKTVSNATPNVGDAITFTVTATNNGPGPASGVNVVDLLPAGLQLTNATTTQGVYTGASGLWTIGSLANGGSAILTIFATVIGSTTQTNTATLSHTDSIDSISSNNQASAALTPLVADLAVTKTVDSARPNVGDTVTFLVTVAGNGPNSATNVQLTDLLPAGLSFVSSTASTGTTYNSTSGVWSVGTITNGGNATLQIKARVVGAAVQVNTASVTHSDVFDPNTANNSASATVTPQQADLKLTKSVSNASPNVGDNITFLVTLSNLGPDFATGVTVQDSLPAGLTFVSADPSQGIYNPISGQWTVGVVDPATPRTLALVATVVSSAAQQNVAVISGANQFDPVTTNNTAAATETPQEADLVVTKAVDNPTPNVGDTITFTVTVKNNGPNSATNVQVNDLLPTGLVYIANTASQGNYFSTTGTWTVGIVNNGAQETLTILAQVASPTVKTNTATAMADQFDPNSSNNSASATETPQQADLAVTKTVSDTSPNVGDNITYTITVANNGPNPATNVTVQEVAGSGLVFVSANPTQGTFDPATGIWTVGTVGLVGTPSLVIVARATTTDPVTNSASIKHSDQFDPNPVNNSDFTVVKGTQADLAVTKTVDKSTAAVGDTVTFTVTVTNLNGSNCSGVQLTDELPPGLQYVSSFTSDGSYNNVSGIWALAGNLGNGQSETLTIQARMLTTTTQTNTATVTFSDRPDPNLGNNSGDATVNPATADLVISKSVNDPNPNIGANINYTIRLTDSGPDTATNVTVQDLLPSGVTYVSSSASQGSYDPISGQWTVGTVNVGTPQTLVITCTVTRLLPGPNTASISHSDQFDPVTANNSDSASITPLSSDLAITKTVSNSRPNVGDTITFQITLANTGPASATNVTVADILPAGLTFVGAIPTQGIYTAATGVWRVGTLVNNNVVILTIQALVVSSATQTNTAAISHSDQFDPNSGNNSDTATVTPQQADLEVSKFVDNAAPNVGDTVNFTIDIENIGPNAATNVLLNDPLPAGLAYVSAAPSQGDYDPGTGVWTVGTIPDGDIPTLILSAQVVISGVQINTASIGHSDQPDPNTANNQASATVTTLQADLQLTKTVNNARPNVGDTIAFTVTLTDLGPGLATNVEVSDLLPTGLTLLTAIPSQGSYDPATGLWFIPTVTTALARTLILNAHVDGPDPGTNTATIIASDVFDPDSGNNTASVTETPQQADLVLTKTVSNAHPNLGDTITYAVTLTNAGPDGATHVQVADLLPEGIKFGGAIPSQGKYSNVTGLWDVGDVAAGAVATLQILANVDSPSPQLNTATISEADQFDPDSANDSAGALETPQQADLSVRKSASNPTPNVGDTVTYTIRVTNSGPDAATGVVLSDVLPAGVSYQSSLPTEGTYDPTTRTWTVGTVANGVTQTLTILASVVNISPQANTATISHADQFDPNEGNNFDTASINPQASDLQIAKTVSNPTPNVGDTITFTVTLTNDGPSAASNVQVTDLLPAGLSFVSATPSPGTSYDSVTGLWTVGTVTTATPQTLTIQAQVVSAAAQTNTAAISAADQFDPDPANDQDSVTVTPQQADLVIAKAVSNQKPNVGDTVTFVVAVADRGPNAATNVTVQDLLPAGLSLVSFTPSRGTYDPTTGIWTIGSVDPSAAQTLTLIAQVTGASLAINTATISHSDQFDPNTGNNSASASVTPQQADVILAKAVSNANPNVGDVITYTVTVGNKGPDSATGVELTDLLPAGLTLVLATPSQGAYSSATGLWTVGQVDTIAPATLTLEARVASPAPATNVATITHSNQFDPDAGNNTASATETPQQADLQITKTVSDPTPNVGDTITFVVTVTNNGPDPATHVVVLDRLPTGLGLISAGPSQGVYDPIRSIWAVGTVAPGAPQTLTFTAEVIDPEARTNTARVGHSDQFDPNTGNNTASATETPQQADLQLSKTVSNPTPNVGDMITYTITLTNAGPDAATGVAVHDLLPAGVDFVSATPAGSYDPVGGVWTVGTVNPGTPQTLTITATVVSPAAQTNTATISAADQFDPQTGNDTSSATETPQQADLQLSKTVSNPTPNVGDTITYSLTLTNAGPDAATGVAVHDLLPAGVTFVSATPAGSYDPVGGVWTVGTVNPGTPQTLIITAKVVDASPGANSASVSHADQFDPNTANNSDTASVNPLEADLALSKTVNNAHPNVGDTVIFTVTLTDNGPADATGVEVTDLLPAGLTLVLATPGLGTYDGVTGLWTVGMLANGALATLTLEARVDSPDPQTNTAAISAADQFDPVTGNDSASATETPQRADLALTKSVNLANPNVGNVISFTVTLTNNGPDAATNVQVADLLPIGLVFVDAVESQGTYDDATGAWAVGTVTTTAPQTLIIQARVLSPEPRTNTATISSADQFDPNGANNSASATETPQVADLALTKTVDDPTPNVGDVITFTVTLTNKGPDQATNVEVQDVLPSGLTFLFDTPSQGIYTPFPGVWDAGTLATGAAATLRILARVDSPIPRINTADILIPDQFDPDTTNNSASVLETPQQADLAVAKTVSDARPDVGDTITFTVTLTNAGPDPATNVEVNDLLPAGLTFLTAIASQGDYADATGIWVVGTVTPGAPQTLQIEARVDSPVPRTNTATITQVDQFDPNTANDQASATETPQQADLAVTKTVSDPTPNVGDTITFTINLTNIGLDTATGVTVEELLPAGLSFVSAGPTQGSYDNATGVWTAGTVTVATPASLVIQARVDSPVPQTNVASISAADQFDPNTGNDSASATETPQQSDLAVSKMVDDPTPNVGDTVTFTVTLSNAGPDTATNVVLTDLLPVGLTFVSATPSQGNYDSATGLWTVGDVVTTAAPTLILAARVDSPDSKTNTAFISHSDQFDPVAADNTSGATETPQQADLALTKTVSDPTPNVGDTITFIVTLTNLGPNSATNVRVTDLLPVGLNLVSNIPSQGNYDSATGLWSVGTVGISLAPTLTLTATVAGPGTLTNTATFTGADQFDPDSGNNQAAAAETPQQADVRLSKSVSDARPNVGDLITYTVMVSNAGPSDATGVRVTDLLPGGLSFVTSTVSLGVYNSVSGLWTVGSVAMRAVETLQILARVNSPDPQFNMAVISAADQFDPNTSNNTAGALETPQLADLEVGKSVSDPTPNVGDVITYTVHVTNNGPDDATGVTVSDVLPAGVAYQSSSATAGAYEPSTRIWTVGGVAAGATQTLTITAMVVGANTQTNTAMIDSADQFDPDTANNSDSTAIDPQQADLALGKTVSDPTPNVDDTITFVVTLTDNGPHSATNVQVTDLLPAGLTFVSDTPSQGTYDPATGMWAVGTVTTAAPQTLTIRAIVAASGARTNTASITASDQFDPDSGNNTAAATETPQQADLQLSKTVDDATPNVGDTITFTVSLSNVGPDAATGVTVHDLLPVGLTFVSDTPSQGTYDPATGMWAAGTVDPGFAQTLVIQALVVGSAPATNTAGISGSDQFDPNAANNTAGATETPQQADVSITKTVNNPTPNVGDVVIFTVTVTNSGPDPATDVQVTDLLPAGLTLVLATPSQGVYSGATGLWTVGQVGVASPATLTLRARVASATPATNVATITHSDQFDPDAGNNTASATETPQQADLQITKTVSDPTPNVGDIITFVVTVTNNGPDAATRVVVLDKLPTGLAPISVDPSQGTYDPFRAIWAVGTLAPGVSQTLTFTAEVLGPQAETNTAMVGHSDQFDPQTGNNQAAATETPQQSDLALTKTVSNARPNVNDTITFTVTLTNAGPDAATGVAVHDLLPAGVTFVSATPAGSYDPVGGVWTVGTVNPGTPRTLTITATVVSPVAQTNTATISASDQFDPNTGNDTASATETPQQSDLQISKTVSDPTPNVGDTITYAIILTNNGPDAATGVTVQDTLPAGVAFVSATPVGSYDPVSGLWTVGTVNPGTPQTLTITATVISPTPGANSASVDHADQFDPNTANNSDTASVDPLEANLALSKTVSNASPNVGDTIAFTVTLTDNGPADATGVQVTDLLPAGLTFVSDTPSQGTTYDSVNGLWTVGALANGAQVTLTLNATVDSPDAQTNTAAISASDQFDPSPGNDTASATETPQQSDLQVTKSVNLATPNVGDVIEFTVTLTNVGPDAATNVRVADLLHIGLVFVDDLASQGTYDGTSGIWMVGTVTTAASPTLAIRARVVSPDPRTNTATISSADQFDPVGTNDNASATETPQQADLALTKTVDNPTPNVGDIVTFKVTLTNNGPDSATGVVVQDVLPAGLFLVSANAIGGTYVTSTGFWNLGTVGTAVSPMLILRARVVDSISRINTAEIEQSDQFDPNTTNDSASALETPQQADLAVTKTVSDARPNVGDTITFTVTLSNAGPDPATNVEVTDLLPAGVTFLNANASQGAYADTTGIWVVGTITPGAPQTLNIDARVDSPDAQTNTATITQVDQFDPQTGNDQASATETPQQSDLQVSKTVSDPTPNVGDTITFTINLSNIGPDPATGVTVQELLPAGLSFVSGIPTQGSYDNTTGVWTVGTVTVTTPPSLAIKALVDSPDSQTNTARISAVDQFDPQTGNDTSSATETPQQADLALTKTVSNSRPNVGDTITFTVTVSNGGPNPATGVMVQELLPAGLTFVSDMPSQGTYLSTTGVWAVGTVTTAEPQTLTIRARVDSPNPQTNSASVEHADQFDPQTADNQAGVVETPQRADLALTKTVSNSTPYVGDVITFTVTLSNSGPDPATDVVVNDPLPAGLSFVSAAPSQGTYDPATGVWAVGTLAPGTSQNLQIQARVVGMSPQANTASVGHSDQFDPVAANSSASATATPQTADLAVAKTAGPGPFAVGQQITYTLTVANRGPADDPDVVLVDQLPAGMTFVSASVAPASQSSGSLTFRLGTLAAGASATIIVIARADEAGAFVNQASTSGALPDLVPSNDATSVTTTVSQTAPTVLLLQRFGFHEQPTALVLTFSEPLDPARAQDLDNYRLVLIAHGGRLHHPVRLSHAVYNATSRTVTLHPARLLPLRFRYRLTVNGTTSTGVSGASGVLLDGDGDGQPGGNYVRTFGRGILAGPNRSAGLREHGLVHLSPPGCTRSVRLPWTRVAHSASAGPRHVGTVASATGRSGSDLHPSAVDAVLEAIVVRLRRK